MTSKWGTHITRLHYVYVLRNTIKMSSTHRTDPLFSRDLSSYSITLTLNTISLPLPLPLSFYSCSIPALSLSLSLSPLSLSPPLSISPPPLSLSPCSRYRAASLLHALHHLSSHIRVSSHYHLTSPPVSLPLSGSLSHDPYRSVSRSLSLSLIDPIYLSLYRTTIQPK